MGKRSWQLKCLDCETQFGTWFENFTREELIEWLRQKTCDNCSSDNWIFTKETRFAGSSAQSAEYVKIRCQSEFKFKDDIRIGGEHRHSVLNKATVKSCPSCDDQDWEIKDQTGKV